VLLRGSILEIAILGPGSISLPEARRESMTEAETLSRIESILTTKGKVSREMVRQWMRQSSLEVLGAVYELVTYSPHWERIEPPLEERDLLDFLITFYKRCLLEDPKGEWALSRYEAAAAIASRFRALAHGKKCRLP